MSQPETPCSKQLSHPSNFQTNHGPLLSADGAVADELYDAMRKCYKNTHKLFMKSSDPFGTFARDDEA